MLEKYYKVHEVAEQLSLSDYQICEYCKNGKHPERHSAYIPGALKLGKIWLIPESGIQAFIEVHRVEPVESTNIRPRKKRAAPSGRITMDIFKEVI